MALLPQGLNETCLITSESGSLTATHLFPHVIAALGATAGTKQVVVQLIVSSRFRTIENRGRCPFEPDHDSAVVFRSENMAAQAIILPPKIISIVEATSYILPFAGKGFLNVRIRRHPGQGYDSGFFCGIWPSDAVYRPCRRRKRDCLSMYPGIVQQLIDS